MLDCTELGVRYDALPAVRGVTLGVPSARIVCVLGPNGAGKSSLLGAISGQVRPVAGSIRFDGEAIEMLPPHAITARGIAHVPEGRMLFGDLSLRENLLLGAHNAGSLARAADRLDATLDAFPMLRSRLDEPAGMLSGGQAQMLALARGLMAAPKLILLDEPSLGLSPKATADVFRLVAALPARGVAVLLVEQNVRRALAVSGYAYLMRNGLFQAQGPAAELMRDPMVQDAYFGDLHAGE
ncbi:ABC transporter ATP-binding protein [Desertibaculum subflavum]|uniref:ABC transporter ATP-binding protein n=1 Tax=Desertibaculum subflavum TaxID=2268458 RepID=UPI000E665D38